MSNIKTIKTSKLLELLNEIKTVVTKEIDSKPIVIFNSNQIIANNNIAEYKIAFKANFENCILDYKKLYDLIKSLPSKNKITLEQKRSKFIVYHKSTQNQNRSSSLPILNMDNPYENLADLDESESIQAIPEDFSKALSRCLPILPKESIRFDLNLMKIEGDKVIASDDARACQYTMTSRISDQLFYLSGNHIDIFLSGSFEDFHISKDLIQFSSPIRRLTLSLPYDVSYPTIDNSAFEKNTNINLVVNRKRFISELDRTIIFSTGESDSTKKAKLKLADNKYVITAKSEFGKNKEFGRVKTDKDIQFDFNPVYLRQGLSNFTDKEIEINISKLYDSFQGYKLVIREDNLKFVLATYSK